MKYFIDKRKEIFGFDIDGSQDNLITDDMVQISIEEINKINQEKEDIYKQSLDYSLNENSVPIKISRLQAKLQLLEIGLLDEVEDLVAKNRKVQLYWNEADNFYRTDSILLGMATDIGLTDEKLDDLFIEASKLCQII